MFNEDLKLGQLAENKFADYLIAQGFSVLKTYGNNKDFDLATYQGNSIINTWEVKYDLIASKSGNLAIECMFKGQKSGILSTKADYLVIYTKSRFYVLKTQEFREWLSLNKPYLKIIKGGDNGESLMVLLKTTDLTNKSWCSIDII